jgi:curved DNA-binding protein
MEFKDYYEILGVLPDAEKKVIKQTYRQLATHRSAPVGRGSLTASIGWAEVEGSRAAGARRGQRLTQAAV